jgi:DNA-binding transcriptional ArsR family regulator
MTITLDKTTTPSKAAPSTSVAAILAHPTRARIWHRVVEGPVSSAQMAKEFGCDVTHVSYHVKQLEKAGAVEEVGSRPVRGAVEHFWRSVRRPEISKEEAAEMDPDAKIANVTLISQSSFADLGVSLDSGRFVERDEHVAVRLPGVFDEEGFAKASKAYTDLLDLLYDTEAESKIRIAKDPSRKSINITALGFLFEKPAPTT